jgi:hypothetical protein
VAAARIGGDSVSAHPSGSADASLRAEPEVMSPS